MNGAHGKSGFKPINFNEMIQTLDMLAERLDREADPFHVPGIESAESVAETSWNDSPLLDLERFDDLAGVLRAGAFGPVVDGFLETVPVAFENLASFDGDLIRLAREAHTLRGLSANIGALRLSQLAARIEEAAVLHGKAPTAETIDTLRTVVAETVAVIAERRARLG
ncbi:MAG: Hpt domain-containing protein [Alphaproteobacteria bacterium]|nr:Hpt domain-containing protein [Alphaproteobacteria bacterium]